MPMARPSNVNERLIQHLGRKPGPHTYRRPKRKSLPDIYDVPRSPSAPKIEDGHTPSSAQRTLAESSYVSSSSSKRLRRSEVSLRPPPIANEPVVRSTRCPALQQRRESSRTRIQLRSELPPGPQSSERNILESAAGERPNNEFLKSDVNRLTTGIDNESISDDRIKACTTEVAGVDNSGKANELLAHARASDEEYFDVEAIKDCKLGSRGMVFLQVKWKGYEDPSDITWQVEEGLRRDIPDVVDAYFKERGGRDKVINDIREKKATKRVPAGTRGIARVKA